MLRGVWTNGQVAPVLPSSPRQFLGTIIHQLFEHVLSGEARQLEGSDDVEGLWDKLTSDMEARMLKSKIANRFVPLAKNIPQFAIFRARALRRARELRESRRYTGGIHKPRAGTSANEAFVNSRDGIFRGRIDRIVNTSDGGVVIQDYKTGPLLSERSDAAIVKSEYREQLLVYAALYFETTGQWPTKLQLLPIVGEPIDIDYTIAECNDVMVKAYELIQKVNAIISRADPVSALEEMLASPSPEACKFCTYRPACSAYTAMASASLDVSWPVDVWGASRTVQKLGNGTWLIELETTKGAFFVRELYDYMWERGVPAERRACVGVYGLRRTHDEHIFQGSAYTMVFERPSIIEGDASFSDAAL